MKKISIIVAIGSNRAMGWRNQLPWHLPADLKRFKSLTMGKPMIMGRRTFESIGKILPGRTTVIVTKNKDYKVPGCHVVNSLEQAFEVAGDVEEIMVIGGASLFQQVMSWINRIYLTIIHEEFEADTFFPTLNEKEWVEVEREEHEADEKNRYAYAFVRLERRNQK